MFQQAFGDETLHATERHPCFPESERRCLINRSDPLHIPEIIIQGPVLVVGARIVKGRGPSVYGLRIQIRAGGFPVGENQGQGAAQRGFGAFRIPPVSRIFSVPEHTVSGQGAPVMGKGVAEHFFFSEPVTVPMPRE